MNKRKILAKMINKRIKKGIILSVIFVLAAFIVVGEGLYRKTLSKESIQLGAIIPSKSTKPIIYDIANQGIPKRLVQPGKISIATGHGASGVINKGKEPVAVQVKVEGFSGNVQITSTDSYFEKQTGKFTKPIQPGKELSLSVILDIPRNELNNKSVSSGNIQFTDYNTDKLLATLPVKIVNSNVSTTK